MKEKVISLIGNSLEELHLSIFDVLYEREDGNNYLRIVLDSDEIIDINAIVKATKIINPLIDETNLIDEAYILDVYAKSKGE